jgi:hypothetical protein
VPLIVPLEESVKPVGRPPPVMVKLLWGAVPPWPTSVWLYMMPAMVLNSVAGVKLMVGAATATV